MGCSCGIVAALRHDPRRLPHALAGRRGRRRRRPGGVRRVGVASLHSALRDDAGAAGRRPAAARAAPQRHPHDARASRASRSGSGRWPTSSPTWSSTPATTWRTWRRCRPCSTRSGRCSTCRASSCSAPTTTTPRPCATRCKYLLPDDGGRNTHTAKLPWQDLKDAYAGAGWLDLTNRRVSSTVGDLTRRLGGRGRPAPGVRRPGRGRRAGRRRGRPAASASRTRRTSGCSTSTPPTATTPIFAGHTHGGQVCLPLKGALVTNCDLEPARAKGLHRHPADSRPGDPGSSWMHVSAGLGTSPYAPFRVACRPEATLLTLT